MAPLLLLAACIACVHWQSLVGAARLTAHHDNLDGAAPLRVQAAAQWKSGHLPLWNPYKRAGMPLLADTTAGAIYPGNAPFLFVPTPGSADETLGLSVFRALDLVAVLHALIAGLGMFVFLRAIAIGAPAATLGALLYACSGTIGWFAAWYIQIQNSIAWTPLVLAAVHNAASSRAAHLAGRGPERVRAWSAAGAAAVALQFFAGFPETSFYTGLVAIGYAFSLARAYGWRPFAAVARIYSAGIVLAAVQLMPSLELQSLSRRPGGLTLEVFQSLPATLAMFRGWLMPSLSPELLFPPAAAYHFGAVAVAAALVGLARLDRRTAFFTALLAIGILLSLGAATPVSGWAHQIPGLSSFRHPFKHLFEVSLAMAGLAGLGAERLSAWRGGAAGWIVPAAVVLVTVSLAINQHALVAGNQANVDTSGRTPEIAGHLERGWRVLTPRQVPQRQDPEFLLGDYPSEFGVAALHGAGPFLWQPLAEATGMIEEEISFQRGLFEARDRTLALLSCRYIVQTMLNGRLYPPLDPSLYRTAYQGAEARLVERDDALPMVRFVDGARCSDSASIASALEGGSVDPARVALVECSGDDRPSSSLAPASSLSVRIVSDEPGRLELATEMPAGSAGFLVVSKTDFPGWQASADGSAIAIRRVHGLVQGIEVPGGTRRVELRYWPRSFVVGAATSIIALLVLLVAVDLERRRENSGKGTDF